MALHLVAAQHGVARHGSARRCSRRHCAPLGSPRPAPRRDFRRLAVSVTRGLLLDIYCAHTMQLVFVMGLPPTLPSLPPFLWLFISHPFASLLVSFDGGHRNSEAEDVSGL